MSNNTYKGTRGAEGCRVTVNGFRLDPRVEMVLDSGDTEFDWGCYNKGAAQLAMAILAHEYDAYVALRNFQEFKREVISQLAHDGWSFDSGFVAFKLAAIVGSEGARA